MQRAKAYIRQTNDWTGLGTWKINFNVTYNVTAGVRTQVTATFSGVLFKNASNLQPISAKAQAANVDAATVTPNTADVVIIHTSQSVNFYGISGDVECDKKPSFHN